VLQKRFTRANQLFVLTMHVLLLRCCGAPVSAASTFARPLMAAQELSAGQTTTQAGRQIDTFRKHHSEHEEFLNICLRSCLQEHKNTGRNTGSSI
jgi:hypothetical protein